MTGKMANPYGLKQEIDGRLGLGHQPYLAYKNKQLIKITNNSRAKYISSTE